MEYVTDNWVVAGNLVCAPDPASIQALEDIKTALLFAQMKADVRCPLQRSSAQWFAEYNKALIALKWLGTGIEGQSFEPGDEDILTIESIIGRFLLNDLAPAHAEHVTRALACLSGSPEARAQALFKRFTVFHPPVEEYAHQASNATGSLALLISVLLPDQVVKYLWLTFMTTAAWVENFLQQPFTGAQLTGAVQARVFQRTWNAAGYARVRATVEKYLADRPAEMILPLACSEAPD
ncbi:hypothetical protein TRP66_13605 [Pseudomonas sp. JDS28PS106]|uniref:hypothetical protein n=1 Tax=Pseudomonas sp. JDS28PS106 TaxID=2497235 RepID=UPI002FD1DE68